MINLVVDIGNSSTKIAVFDQDSIILSDKAIDYCDQDLQKLKEKYQIENLIISSVRKNIGLDEEYLKSNFNYIKFNHSVFIPIDNKYESPTTLGLDRLAAVIGANKIYPKQKVLVIDAGTCITYDGINEKAIYNGGSISPGINMRFEAMHHFTSKLPLVSFDSDYKSAYGKNTNEAILSGVINGLIYELEGFIKQELNNNKETKIILCGGDAAFFDSRFKNSIFAHLILHEPNLVLIGLNTVVNYQHDFK
ncbi:MAG: type III pantothenate kinase [Bacteroidetes bacterium]|nr:type III pantothenate kinase [Bacteroidota bacterium]MBU1484318.1 type III pantothenate kinase [Bacteroidota bacterium]MBU2045814.1 type III pantothenate kinase [Bacteroidota bacterium]MBU2266815.1 type III pantothenate kinase [Bacteroidota bacterium]MBU2377018.1 type III pantothenate kinase [Bacteroidota bacterium]